ncbi:unnamed protein product [Rhizophagus irregularis]|nr:unnamed protein product [Rhizophagus irregularis]
MLNRFKKNIPSPTTTSVTGSSKSSAPLKIKIPRSEALLRDKQKRRLSTDPRRAIFTFENQKYRAKLVDLPCIIEAQKTFNKIQYYKVADICQMLVVESQIQDDEQLFTENSKSSNVDEFEWPDGLTTPPLKNVRKRRFRKRISAKKIEDIEKEVEKLLHEDSLAEEVKLGTYIYNNHHYFHLKYFF